MWGFDSEAGFGTLTKSVPGFVVPSVLDAACCILEVTPIIMQTRIKIQHITTTLAFRFQGAVIMAVDSRVTAGSYVASGTVKLTLTCWERWLVVLYWETYLGMHCRLHKLRNRERISVSAASEYLSNLVYSYKGMGLSIYYQTNDDTVVTQPASTSHSYLFLSVFAVTFD
ncbi:hypothetical protein DFJ58DRAFT_917983 [Suillus subalutaceus]|uniref:uncharacterized protein n=1 Tax=Suillus subalutaceus TaxID=48586 RepID=UPI001B85FF27|nr:uncharacterized protein DFJ58DRAFT_917983 [Suillus subalutaceus]KAG1834353.1 hypothetical protein DFJ58DRAFT_917983 [Suillus subalutaceus]